MAQYRKNTFPSKFQLSFSLSKKKPPLTKALGERSNYIISQWKAWATVSSYFFFFPSINLLFSWVNIIKITLFYFILFYISNKSAVYEKVGRKFSSFHRFTRCACTSCALFMCDASSSRVVDCHTRKQRVIVISHAHVRLHTSTPALSFLPTLH